MNVTLFQQTLKGPICLDAISLCRQALQLQLPNFAVPTELQQKMLLCLSEVLTNFYRYAQDITQVGVQLQATDTGWQLSIEDDGAAFSPTEHADDQVLLNFSEQENGRGLAIITSVSDQQHYQSTGRSNCLILTWQRQLNVKPTLLLVEDNASLLALYRAYLNQTYRIVTAQDGEQALEKLQQIEIDLVVSDIRMPNMSGLTLRKKIACLKGSAMMPFIFLTAADDELVQQQANGLGIDDYLLKPISKKQLCRSVERVLERNLQVYQQLSHRIEQDISASLQPDLPTELQGWRCQVASRNTGLGGGDLLTYKRFPAMTQLVLADIMGHDDSAKFFSHACCGFIHGLMQSLSAQQQANQILQQVSHFALSDQVLSKVTLTACSIQLSPHGMIDIASAGHPAPLLVCADKAVPIDITGVMPGLLPHAHYDVLQMQVLPGQRLAFYTDGLFESATDDVGRAKLQHALVKALKSTLCLPIDKAMVEVMQVFDEITCRKPSDDALLMLIEPSQA
ncbi:response regulator [Motilimonas pumila]|uniref:Response regulator n=1 Tax=Motilimonas pumila TaxID=2303987 RepID=A0A418YDA0_9GAMM|nr:response regulator [Motilimonas pumila]RJG42459.1 response regulator [Motilimonas pumila]